eukprot:COSAG01_NODE_365_length_18082_cov_9.136518_11_plen_229_part_00
MCLGVAQQPGDGIGSRHEFSLKPWAPPKSPRPAHWEDQMWPSMDHEVLIDKAKEKEEQRLSDLRSKAEEEAARRIRSPEDFIALVHLSAPGAYLLSLGWVPCLPPCLLLSCHPLDCSERCRANEHHPGTPRGTLRVVGSQVATIAAEARQPWNGRFELEGAAAELTLRLLIVRLQQARHGGVLHNRGGQVRGGNLLCRCVTWQPPTSLIVACADLRLQSGDVRSGGVF